MKTQEALLSPFSSPVLMPGHKAFPPLRRRVGIQTSGGAAAAAKLGASTVQVPWELASSSDVSIRAQDAWKITRGSPNITVGIIDEDFDVRRLPSAAQVDVVSASGHGIRSTGTASNHGTHLAELIVGSKDGYPGVCPECSLLLIKLPSYCTDFEEAYAFDLALQLNVAVVCCAWGPPYVGPTVYRPMPEVISQSILELATKSRGGRGCLIFFAVGSAGADVGLDGYANHPMVRPVGGITRLGRMPRNLDLGEKIELVAPASSMDGKIGGPLEIPEGASGAVALMSGVAGLVSSANQDLFAEQVFSILKESCGVQNSPRSVDDKRERRGVVDAYRAALSAEEIISKKGYYFHRSIVEARQKTLASGKKQFRERRYNGGEHSFFGLTAAAMLQNLYQTNQATGHAEKAFFGPLFSSYTSSQITAPSYLPSAQTCIDNFFANNSGGSASVSQIANYPTLATAAAFPFGYMVGLAADVYGSPDDLLSAFTFINLDEHDNLLGFVGLFQAEIQDGFQSDDDWKIFACSLEDPYAYYISLAKKNYSHFVGYNLLFYLSYHLLAVSDAALCGQATDQTSATQYFNSALMKEAFALHFLTDMFSAGHARVPRWAFLHANPPLTYTVSVQPSGTSGGGSGSGTSGGTGGGRHVRRLRRREWVRDVGWRNYRRFGWFEHVSGIVDEKRRQSHF